MKELQKLCAATTLIFVLTFSGFAGDITTGAPQPATGDMSTPTPAASASVTESAQISTGEIDYPALPEDLVTEITLGLLQLLSVF